MSLAMLVLVLLVVGVLLAVLNRYAAGRIDGTMLWIINAVVLICATLYVLDAFGVLNLVKQLQVPRVD